MAIQNGYADLTTLKAVLDITDSDDDAVLEGLIEQVSRWIDQYTHRRFYATTETRYYTAPNSGLVEVDDLLSVTALTTDDDGDGTYETTWDTGDFSLYPDNAELDGIPYNAILATGDYAFPKGRRRVKVAGSFGYSPTVPGPITRACLLQAARLWKREDAPFGVSGPNAFGQAVVLSEMDPDVKNILDYYRVPML